jgi:transcriptional regulator with XRE-family HTH domain
MARFRIKQIAAERGLVCEEVAQLAGLRVSTTRRVWANKVSDPSYSTLAAIARGLNVAIEDLVEPETSAVPARSKRVERELIAA